MQTAPLTRPRSPQPDVTPRLSAPICEADLNAAVKQVHELKSRAALSMWTLGRAILDIHDRQLWKVRSRQGRPAYKSFAQFSRTELGLSKVHAFRLMAVARAFSEEQVASFGTTKLALVLQAPPEHREALLSLAKHGASTRALSLGPSSPQVAQLADLAPVRSYLTGSVTHGARTTLMVGAGLLLHLEVREESAQLRCSIRFERAAK
jgi:hypothetical protein